jgi:hypothetical protein
MGQILVDNGLSGPTSFVTIPESLRVVVKKMMPEITLMGVARVEAFKKYNPSNFDVIDEYIVKLRLTFDGGVRTLNGSNEYYGEEIDKLFHFTYPDYEFVKFSVDEMDVRPEKTNYEKFIELFSKKFD